MKLIRVGVDLAKNVFQVHGVDRSEKAVWRRKLTRERRFRRLLHGLWGELQALDERMTELDCEIAAIAQNDPAAKRLQQLRGVEPITATALVAAVGTGEQFANGRQMSAAFGLTPRQNSSGGKERLLGISKRGDAYLRMLLIHGARSVIRNFQRQRRPSQSVGDPAGRP